MGNELHSRSFQRRGHSLIPSDPFAEEWLSKIKDGTHVLVSAKRPRNIHHHRKLFALLRKVVDNSDRWADETVLLDDLKLATGLFETRISALTGMPYPAPASISFGAMDQSRFEGWYEKAVAVLAVHLGVSPEELAAEADAMAA